jgi:ribosomal protein S12 methylthiotransferase accessory factor YcaO
MDIDEETTQRIRGMAAESHVLEAAVRRAILEQLQTQGTQVVGAREILDLAEAFAWVTNPGQAHGGRA